MLRRTYVAVVQIYDVLTCLVALQLTFFSKIQYYLIFDCNVCVIIYIEKYFIVSMYKKKIIRVKTVSYDVML